MAFGTNFLFFCKAYKEYDVSNMLGSKLENFKLFGVLLLFLIEFGIKDKIVVFLQGLQGIWLLIDVYGQVLKLVWDLFLYVKIMIDVLDWTESRFDFYWKRYGHFTIRWSVWNYGFLQLDLWELWILIRYYKQVLKIFGHLFSHEKIVADAMF